MLLLLCYPEFYGSTWATYRTISCSSYLLTYSVVQSPSWAANWFAASQEIPRISRNPKAHYRLHHFRASKFQKCLLNSINLILLLLLSEASHSSSSSFWGATTSEKFWPSQRLSSIWSGLWCSPSSLLFLLLRFFSDMIFPRLGCWPCAEPLLPWGT